MPGSIIISGPLGLRTRRDDITGALLLDVEGIGITAGGAVYYKPGAANAGEQANLAFDPASGWVSAIKES